MIPTADGIPVYCAHDEIVPTVSVTGNPRNPNTHPKRQLELLARIIEAQGWRAPITVSNRSGFVVRGHGRLAAAHLLGKTHVPVDRQDYADEAAEWADLIADNHIAELADPDEELLASLIAEIDDDMQWLTGYDDSEVTSLIGRAEITEDEIPEPPVDPVTKPGDLYLLGSHRLLCGSATDPEDAIRLHRGGQTSCVMTDPPYGVAYLSKRAETKHRLIANDGLKDADLGAFLLDSLGLAFAAAEEGAPIYVFHADAKRVVFETAFATAGWHFHQVALWVKDRFTLTRCDYQVQHEPILYGWKQGGKHSWYGGRKLRNVIDDQPVIEDLSHDEALDLLRAVFTDTSVVRHDCPSSSDDHPTMKPVGLIASLLENSTKPGDVVHDPFLGSGTTLIACEQIGRVCVGTELDPAYCDVIVRRWEALTGETAVLEAHDGTTAEGTSGK